MIGYKQIDANAHILNRFRNGWFLLYHTAAKNADARLEENIKGNLNKLFEIEIMVQLENQIFEDSNDNTKKY